MTFLKNFNLPETAAPVAPGIKIDNLIINININPKKEGDRKHEQGTPQQDHQNPR